MSIKDTWICVILVIIAKDTSEQRCSQLVPHSEVSQ